MNKFRLRLFLIFFTLIGLSVLTAGIFTANLMKKSHIETLEDSMFRETRVILEAVPWQAPESMETSAAYFAKWAAVLKNSAEARVTFIDARGNVLGDSDHDAKTMDNHLQRAEIQEALQSGVGSAVRYSETLQQNMLYTALPVKQAGQVTGFVRLAMSLQEVESAIRKLWLAMIAGLFTLLVVAGLISYRIARGVTRPLENMAKVAKQIAQMNYEPRVKVNKNDEIAQLGTAINKMADSLERQMAKIQEEEARLKSVLDTMASGVMMIAKNGSIMLLNRPAELFLGFRAQNLLWRNYAEVGLQADLSRLIRECLDNMEQLREEIAFYYPEERIVEASLLPMHTDSGQLPGIVVALHDITVLRKLEQMRSEFVANVSHELKTPIAAVQGFAETLLAGAIKDEATARSFLQIIYDESRKLNRLIGNILDLSEIESKRTPLHFSPVQLRPFVSDLLGMVKAEADKKLIELRQLVGDDVVLEADEDRLRQILINLLANGIAYTPAGGMVSVSAEVFAPESGGEEWVRITVADTGVGIPKKDIPRIFERFYRVDKARARGSGGTGLGLSIVKHLVELHHGAIAVDSEVGIGTTFRVELPVLQA